MKKYEDIFVAMCTDCFVEMQDREVYTRYGTRRASGTVFKECPECGGSDWQRETRSLMNKKRVSLCKNELLKEHA